MARVAEEAMEDGAFGLSYALIYPPDCYADTGEIVEVCEVVARCNGSYITHLRSEGAEIFSALDEAFEIGVRAGVPVEIYHLKAAGRNHWDKMPEVIGRIDRARAGGLDVAADMYPYDASGTGLTAVLPPWTAEGENSSSGWRTPPSARASGAPSSTPTAAGSRWSPSTAPRG